jgi:hypothetical protein
MNLTIFANTSDLLYDRHNYKLVKNNGKTIIFDNWEDAKAYWFQNVSFGNLSYFEVLDKDTLNKKEKRKGFR